MNIEEIIAEVRRMLCRCGEDIEKSDVKTTRVVFADENMYLEVFIEKLGKEDEIDIKDLLRETVDTK